jgi:thioredoxin reductase (NADPH)
MSKHDVIVIGAGIAGLTSALYAVRSGLDVLVIERGLYGGQLQNTGNIENYSGYKNVTGQELSEQMYQQAIEQGVKYTYGDVKSIERYADENTNDYFEIKLNNKTLSSKAVIIATGVEHKKLGVEGEDKLQGRGVSYCATCDANFFKEKHVVVIGGGNSALEEADYLSGIVDKVTLIHRRDTFRGEKVLQDRVLSNDKNNVILNADVKEVVGDSNVDGVTVVKKDDGEFFLPCSGVFVNVGMKPITSPFIDLGITDDEGYIITDENMETSIKGIFAVGDVRSKKVRQITTAVGDGSIAGVNVKSYIDSVKIK